MPPNLPNLKPGDLVAGRFRIVEMVGSGGFSVVYRARQDEMNRFVALKVLKPRAANDPRVVERFRREALYASHLTHPNTITLYDYGQTDDNLFYIAMEYLVGMDLSVLVQRGKPVALKRVWKTLVQCCRSLAEAHRLGLVHRDLKPENIFLVQREEGGESIKVLDFGVSKAISTFGNAGPSTMAPLTQEGTVFGTPLYMAPEQAMAEAITPAVDVYALGHIAFEMVTGRAAYWDCTNPMDVMLRQVNDPPLALPSPWSETPFSKMITRCTQKNAKKRIADASKLLEYLMDDRFAPYMDPVERPMSGVQPTVSALAKVDPVTLEESPPPSATELYRWELGVLEEAFSEVQSTKQPRMVVVRGKPGTGRSNLMRAFLRSLKSRGGIPIIHRQTAPHVPPHAGLEVDIALAMGLNLEATGLSQVKEMMSNLGAPNGEQGTGGLSAEKELRSGPLHTLVNMRDTFLSRLAIPFRERAEKQGILVWGVENLERADTLTVSFLDRFYRDVQAHPLPILIVVTASPEELVRRPGLSRYSERLLNVSPPYGRQLDLMAPGQRKSEDQHKSPDQIVPARAQRQAINVSGSYNGGEDLEFLDELIGEDRRNKEGPKTTKFRADEIFAQAEPSSLSEPSQVTTKDADVPNLFDQVLGYMAQLGDEVPHGLWREVSEKLLPPQLQRASPLVLDQAERFGIISQTSHEVIFSKKSYPEALRRDFETTNGHHAIHADFAQAMLQYFDAPDREQIRLIVEHMVKSHHLSQAISLLRDEGQRAFRMLDFDAAREYFLRIQQLLDQVDNDQLQALDLDGDDVANVLEIERPHLWLRLGEIHGALHEYGAAEDAIGRAIKEMPGDDHAIAGRAHKLLGDLQAAQGRDAQALTHYERAQQCYKTLGDAKPYVAVSAEMGRCVLKQGRAEVAVQILTDALENASKLRDMTLIARVRRYLGQAFTRQARFKSALEQLEASMHLFEQAERQADVVLCLEELGHIAFAASRFDLSRDYYTRAIAQANTSRVSFGRSIHLNLGRALAALENLPKANIHLQEALSTSQTAQEPFHMAEVSLYLGDLALASKSPKVAHTHYEQVARIAKSIGQTRFWFDAIIRQAYAAFADTELPKERVYTILAGASDMAQALGDKDAELQVRTHIIYFQLVDHNFMVQGDTFSSLLTEAKKMQLLRTPILCWLFRADVSTSKSQWGTAREELKQAYRHAAQLGDYAMFIPIARRDYFLKAKLGQLGDPLPGQGFSLGGLLPPEVGLLRHVFE